MDRNFVTRQFIVLTKKFRKESRKALIKLHDAIDKNTKAAEKAAEAHKEQSQANLLVLSAINQPHPKIHEHRTREQSRDPVAWIKLAVEVATLFVLIAYASLTFLQLIELKISAEAAKSAADTAASQLELSERPWISIDPKMADALVIDSSGVHTAVELTLENTGHSPAIQASVVPELLFRGQQTIDPDKNELDQLCSNVNQDPGIFPRTIFPGRKLIMTIDVSQDRSHTDDAAKYWHGKFMASILVCVVYRPTFNDKTTFSTGTIFRLTHPGGPFFKVETDKIIPVEKLRLYIAPTDYSFAK